MKKKILFCATVDYHFQAFHIPYLKFFKENGWEVHVAAKGDMELPFVDRKYNIAIERSPFNLNNLKTLKVMKNIIEKNRYSAIHCHTPMGGVLARLAARKMRKYGTKVLYTAHGFHFFKGAPLLNWLLYYPIEKWIARYTDVLITINKEDYERAKTFKTRKVCYVPGMGVDTQKYAKTVVDKTAKRAVLGVPENATMLLSVGELNKNKNHETVIRAIEKLGNPNLYYVICGRGQLEEYLMSLSKELKISDRVIFGGYRSDVAEICKAADIFIFPSRREGLGLAALEAMASGLPLITSNVHGIVDYSIEGKTAYTCNPTDVTGFAKAISKLASDKAQCKQIGKRNIEVVKQFDIKKVSANMEIIYKEVLGDTFE